MDNKHPSVSSREEEPTSVDPGALDSWQDEKTVADSPSTQLSTSTTDVSPAESVDLGPSVGRGATGSESGNETVDEATIERPGELVLPNASLVLRTGPHEGQTFRINNKITTIGRALGNDVVLVDPSISRKHMTIEFDGKAFVVKDLDSGNGTIINGRDEDNRYQLVNRDALELGRSIVTFESEAMSAKKPDIAPPKPRPVGKNARSNAHRPTQSMRGEAHPKFKVDVDDEASTIAGQRLRGPELLAAGQASPRASVKSPQDLIMPRDRAAPNLRMTLPSPAVPPPARVEPARLPSSRPTLARSSVPPVIAPVDLDEEEPTMASHRHQIEGSMRGRASSLPPAPHRPAPTSAPPPRRPHTSAPPRPGHSSGPQPRIVYPTASHNFNRSGAELALSPRSPMGMMASHDISSGRRWIPLIALLAIATIIGVTVAAITGQGGEKQASVTTDTDEATDADEAADTDEASAAPIPGIVVKGIVAGPATTAKEVAVETDGGGKVATAAVTLKPTLLGNYETDIKRSETIEPPAVEDEPEIDDKAATDAADAAALKKRKSSAQAAYRDRNFKKAASLTREAASFASKKEARTLRRRAKDLSKLGSLLSNAKSASAVETYSAYRKASGLDSKLGKMHTALLNAQLLRTAPEAARSYMAKDQFTSAAGAVTVARKLGDRARTKPIMSSLERLAEKRIKQGKAAARDDAEETARSEFNAARKMLPQQSELYAEVEQLIADL